LGKKIIIPQIKLPKATIKTAAAAMSLITLITG
jgi:hypothetical protein